MRHQKARSTRPTPRTATIALSVLVLLLTGTCTDEVAVRPAAPAKAVVPERPNVIVVVLDTLRYDAVSLSGRPPEVSPRIAALGSHGVSFSNAYSTWDETTGSHFSILTGFASGASTPLHEPVWSLANQVKQRGYATFGVAANLNLSPKSMPVLRPFDDYVCLGDVWNEMPADRKLEMLKELDARITKFGGQLSDFNRLMMYSTGSRTIDVFERQIARAKPPFFGFINLMEPHDPYFPDPDLYDFEAEKKLAGADRFHGDIRNRPIPNELLNPRRIRDAKRRSLVQSTLKIVGGRAWSTSFDLDEAAISLYKRRYAARVREADAHAGRIVDFLRRRGLLDSTIVIITSDHGESFGEKNLMTHAFNNGGDRESTHRVPLLWLFPEAYGIKSGKVAVPVALNDIAPTIYDLIGIDWLPLANLVDIPGTYGRSLLPIVGERRRRRAVTAAADLDAVPRSDSDKLTDKKEAEARLRALGYIQ